MKGQGGLIQTEEGKGEQREEKEEINKGRREEQRKRWKEVTRNRIINYFRNMETGESHCERRGFWELGNGLSQRAPKDV